jgi:hypothetical protein
LDGGWKDWRGRRTGWGGIERGEEDGGGGLKARDDRIGCGARREWATEGVGGLKGGGEDWRKWEG